MKKNASLAILLAVLWGASASFAGEVLLPEGADWTVPCVSMKMKRMPAGQFTMGSPADEMCRRDDETQHRVTITRASARSPSANSTSS